MIDSSVAHTNVHALSFSYHTVLTIILNVTHLIHYYKTDSPVIV